MKRGVWLVLGSALAMAGLAAAQPQGVAGEWSGAYTCSQGLTGMTMSLRPGADNVVDATVTFYAHPSNPSVASGCYAARGRLDPATGRLLLLPGEWIYRPGDGWSTTQFDGRLNVTTGAFEGRVIAPRNPSACTTFALRRGAVPFKPPPSQCTRPALVG